ncbi:hypothetical protein SERLA73DRAFT_149344 [Serpula lacrymans var. lacrymans S7.3]|uniref:Uncharacterized protein n=1 Tax=Serpula lacrymans var. lacrymans (strain S7.3) TaxID=936435 RepID=F8PHY8_SERL3|nr:hypothetical protein SERLA73DRAFT_149344 [Serpula lacrymans var. lacrymans S7.3]
MAIRYPDHHFAMQYGHPGVQPVVHPSMQSIHMQHLYGHPQMPTLPMGPPPTYAVVAEPASQRHQPCSPSPADKPHPATAPSKACLNAEPQPGVFVFMTNIVSGNAKRGNEAVTDMLWVDFQQRMFEMMDGPHGDAQLVYRISGDTGKQSHINNHWDFKLAMDQLLSKTPLVTATAAAKKKRAHKDDVPPVPDPESNRQLKAFKQLEQAISLLGKPQYSLCPIASILKVGTPNIHITIKNITPSSETGSSSHSTSYHTTASPAQIKSLSPPPSTQPEHQQSACLPWEQEVLPYLAIDSLIRLLENKMPEQRFNGILDELSLARLKGEGNEMAINLDEVESEARDDIEIKYEDSAEVIEIEDEVSGWGEYEDEYGSTSDPVGIVKVKAWALLDNIVQLSVDIQGLVAQLVKAPPYIGKRSWVQSSAGPICFSVLSESTVDYYTACQFKAYGLHKGPLVSLCGHSYSAARP